MTQIGKPPCDDALIRHGVAATHCVASARRWVLVAAIVGSSMAFIDGTVVNVALPAIQHDLRASAFQVQWVVESYALFLASLVLVGGALGDQFGRRRIFVAGVALFALASTACALSGDVRQLILARAAQGVGAALLVPGSLALISAAFPEGERGRAIGTWSAFSGITAALGPVMGGALVDHYSWKWAFVINVPLAACVLAIAATRLPESRRAGARTAIDGWGALLATLALGGGVFALIEAPARGWASTAVLAAGSIGLAAMLGFIVVEQRRRSPMLPLALFANRNFAGTNLLTLMLYGALGGGLYFVPLNLIQVQGYSATAAGAALLPFVLIMFIFSSRAGRWVDRVGPRLPLVLGPVIAACGFAAFTWPGLGGSYWTGIFPAVVILGLGMTLTVAPLTTTVMNAVGQDLAGLASGINNAVARAAALLAIAAFGMLMAWVFETSLAERLRAIGASSETAAFMQGQLGKLADAALPPGLDAGTTAVLHRAVGESFVAGYRWIMALSAALALAGALSAWVTIEARTRPAAAAR